MKLQIDIEAKFAQFSDSLNKVGRDVDRSVGRMNKSFGMLRTVAAAAIGALAGIATIGGIKSVIDDLDKLNTVSERSGIGAEALSGLAFAAKQSGTDLDVLAKGVNKLSIAMSELSTGGNDKLKNLFDQLGLGDLAKGAATGEQALIRLAEVFPRLSEIDQARVAAEAFGEKIGSQLVPALALGRKELEGLIKEGKELFPVTNNLAKAADDFNDAMSKVGLVLKATLLPALEAILPLLTGLAEGLANGKRAGLGFFESLEFLFRGTPSNGYGDQIKSLTKQIEAAEKAAKSAQTSFLGIKTGPADATDIETLKKRREFFKAQQRDDALALGKGIQSNEGRVSVPGQIKLKPLPEKTTKGPRDTSAEKLLIQQLKDFEHTIEEERALASTRNEFLDRYYQQGLIALSDYTLGRKNILSESVRNETAAINSEIALLEKSKSGQKGGDKIQTQTKINELIEKRTKLESESSVESIKLFLDGQRDAAEYARSIADINVQLLEMQGNLGEAAKIRFGQQNAGIRTTLATEVTAAQKRVDTTPDGPARDVAINDLKQAQSAQQKLDALEKNAIAQANVNRLEEVSARIRQDAAEAEERAYLAAQSGATTEIESLQAINAIRKQEVESLTGIAGLYDAIAKASDDKRITQGAKAMRLEIDKLAASADLLRDKFQGVFTSAFSSFFDKLTSGTVSLKDAFKSLVSDFTSQIAKLAQQNIIDQLFSTKGAAGGAPGFLAGLFGSTGTQKPAPVSEGIASSTSGFLTQTASSGAQASQAASTAASSAASLAAVGQASTATTFALKEFADDGLAKATGQLFENVAVSTVESTATQTATGSLATLTIAAEAAASALASMAASAAASGAVQSAAGGFADGGLITGAGTGTSDSIPAMLSNNEFVVRAEPVKQPGALQFLHKFNREGMSAVRKYVAGGMVTPASVAFMSKIQHFATGGLVRGISQYTNNYTPHAAQTMAVAGGGQVNLTQNFIVQPSTPRETQQQFAAAAFQGGARALRRNR